MKKYPKIPHASDKKEVLSGSNIVVLEKIDGANARFSFTDSEEILFGTRRTKQTENGEPLGVQEMNKNFRHCYKYLQETIEKSVLEEIDEVKDMTFFGESLQKHTIDYDAWSGNSPDVRNEIPNFIGFDIYDGEKFLNFERFQEIYDLLGLETTPVHYSGSSKDINWETFDIPKSKFREEDPSADNEFDKSGLAEGVVVRNEDILERAKIVHPEFKETNKSWKGVQVELTEEEKQANEFINKYVTHARVRKIAHKIKDQREEKKLKMEFMSELPLTVIDDIFEEENLDINRENEDVMSEIRSKTSSKCSNILKEEIQKS